MHPASAATQLLTLSQKNGAELGFCFEKRSPLARSPWDVERRARGLRETLAFARTVLNYAVASSASIWARRRSTSERSASSAATSPEMTASRLASP